MKISQKVEVMQQVSKVLDISEKFIDARRRELELHDLFLTELSRLSTMLEEIPVEFFEGKS